MGAEANITSKTPTLTKSRCFIILFLFRIPQSPLRIEEAGIQNFIITLVGNLKQEPIHAFLEVDFDAGLIGGGLTVGRLAAVNLLAVEQHAQGMNGTDLQTRAECDGGGNFSADLS